jgi:hypothetical protein
MNDKNPFINGIVLIVVISSSIMKQVHIKGIPSSMISPQKNHIQNKIKNAFGKLF